MSKVNTWDERYRRGEHANSEPDPFLVSCRDWLEELLPRRGEALDLAGGAGRNAVYLAGLGFAVTLVDASEVAARRARTLASQHNVPLRIVVADLERNEYVLKPESFDLVVVFFFLERALFPAIRSAVKPGGLVIYRTYTVDQQRYPGRPKHAMHLLKHNELLDEFRGFRILSYEEIVRGKGVAAIVARKPEIKA